MKFLKNLGYLLLPFINIWFWVLIIDSLPLDTSQIIHNATEFTLFASTIIICIFSGIKSGFFKAL